MKKIYTTLLILFAFTFCNAQCPNGLTATITPSTAVCGLNNGSASASAANGVQPYHYKWNTGATEQSINNLGADTYTVTITDMDGCTSSASATVTQVGSPTATATPIEATCGLSNGSATASANNGTSPYTYKWSTGASTITINNLEADSYTATVTDANGCTVIATTTVTQSGSPTADLVSADATCGQSNGTIMLVPNNGQPPYTYKWSTGATTQNVTNVDTGSFIVTVTDANGCTATATATVTCYPLGINNVQAEMQLEIFPNPTEGLINIVFSHPCNNCKIGMMNMVGRTISISPPLWVGETATLDMSSVAAGMYFIRISMVNEIRTVKVLKE